MSTQNICQIPGNPDIAGIGVRTSVYIQACLACFNLIYTVHIRFLAFIKAPKTVEPTTQASQAPSVASTTAVEAPFTTHSSDADRRSKAAGRESPPQDVSDEIGYERPEHYQAFLRANRDYLDMIKVLERGLFMVGFAVIVSAFLEARSTGLTAYHALTILNVSQINNWSGFILLAMGRGLGPTERSGWSRFVLNVSKDSWVSAIPYSLHAAIMSGFGLYFWSDIQPFSIQAEGDCQQPPTYLWLFGQSINVSSVALRIFSLVFYALSALPVIGLFFFTSLSIIAMLCFVIVVALLIILYYIAAVLFALLYGVIIKPIFILITRPLFRTPFTQKILASVAEPISRILSPIYHRIRSSTASLFAGREYFQFITFPLGISISIPLLYTILSTELTIHINAPYIEPETEDRWTYGQTLALFTALVSLALYTHEVGKLAMKWRRRSASDDRDTAAGDIEGSTPKSRLLFVERDAQTD